MKITITLLTACALSFAATHAASIAVSNPSFTTNNTDNALDWTDTEVGGGVIYYDPSEASAPDDIAYIMSSGSSSGPDFQTISQNLSSFNFGLNASSFSSWTVSFDAGFRDDVGQTGTVAMRVALVDLGLDGAYQSSDAILDSFSFSRSNNLVPVDLSPEVATLNFSSTSTNDVGLIFQNLETGATFQRTGMVDNISVTAVPEPGSACFIGLAGLGLLLRRRA